jgi:hypothetical protein
MTRDAAWMETTFGPPGLLTGMVTCPFDNKRLDALAPAELLWIVALSIEENGGPACQVFAVRQLAASLQDLGWWLAEPRSAGGGGEGTVGGLKRGGKR